MTKSYQERTAIDRAVGTTCAIREYVNGSRKQRATWMPSAVRTPLIATAAVGGLIALASACAPPPAQVKGSLIESCRHYAAAGHPLGMSPGGNVTGVRLLSSGAAWIVLVGNQTSPCDATGTIAGSPIPSDRIDVILPNDPDAALECGLEGGVLVGPVAPDADEVTCRTVSF